MSHMVFKERRNLNLLHPQQILPVIVGPYVNKKDMEDKSIVVGSRRIHPRRKRDVRKVKMPSQVVLQLFGPELFKFSKLVGKTNDVPYLSATIYLNFFLT